MLQGQPVELPEGEISLGRSRSCTVPLKDPSASRTHALLMVRGGEVMLRDLNSSNGTFVNGARLTAELALHDGDRVLFGETEAIVRIVPPPDHPSATMHVDLDQFFCPACKAPLPEHRTTCANCGAVRPAAAQPAVAPASARAPLSGSGSRQVIPSRVPIPSAAVTRAPGVVPATAPSRLPGPVEAPAPLPTFSSPPAGPAAAGASNAPGAGGQVLPSISGFDDTQSQRRVSSGPSSAGGEGAGERPLERPPARPMPPRRPAPAGAASQSAAYTPRTGPAVPRTFAATLQPAGFWVRFLAWFLDTLWMTLLAVGASFAAGGPTSRMGQWVQMGVSLGLGLLVPVVGWGLLGTTPGKRLLGLYVGPVGGGVGIGIGKALLRWIGYFVSFAIAGIGFLLIGLSKEKRGLHDHIAGSVVGRRL